jgi:hypothetical protein
MYKYEKQYSDKEYKNQIVTEKAANEGLLPSKKSNIH